MKSFDFIEASAKLIDRYSNVYALNNFTLPTDKDTFNRYLPLNYLAADIEQDQITFSSPLCWDDTFETRYFQIEYSKRYPDFVVPVVNSLCLTSKHSDSEDAKWIRYAKVGAEMINVEINMPNLLHELDLAATKNGFKVYIGNVCYCDKKDIQGINPSSKTNGSFFNQPFTIEKYLSLLSLKRNAFSYEKEVRLFIVFDRGDNEPQKKLYPVKITPNAPVYGRVTISPYPPIKKTFPKADLMLGLDKRKEKVKKALPSISNVCKSGLFEECPKCKL